MASRSRPEMVGFRVTRIERSAIESLAEERGLCKADLLRSMVIPQIREVIRLQLEGPEGAK